MAKTYNKMRLDVSGGLNGIVTEVQGDQNSRYLDINLFNNGIPINLTGHTVRIYMRRPNTNPLEEFFNDGEITEATRGRCQFLLSTQALAKECELEAQVSIWKGTEEILSTRVFKIMVTKKLRTSGSVESSNEYGALVVLFQNLYEAYDLMTTMVQNIGSPSSVAAQYNLATMWQAWEFLTDYMKTDLTNMIERAIANASVQGVLDKIGNASDVGSDTLFGMLSSKRAVKSIQHGTIAFTAKTTTQTISAVDVTRAVVLHTGSSYNAYNATTYSGSWDSRLTLANATTVSAEVGSYDSSYNAKVSFVVIEFY